MRTPKQVAQDKINEKIADAKQAAKNKVNPRAYKDPSKAKTWGQKQNAISRNAKNDARAKRKGR